MDLFIYWSNSENSLTKVEQVLLEPLGERPPLHIMEIWQIFDGVIVVAEVEVGGGDGRLGVVVVTKTRNRSTGLGMS